MMLLLWLRYLYVFIVFPWQFIQLNVSKYDISFNLLYMAENMVWLAMLAGYYFTTRNGWRKIYGPMLACGGVYAIASHIIDLAIRKGAYYSGSLFDLPLIAALLGFVWVVGNGSRMVQLPERANGGDSDEMEAHGPRLAMVALLSIPVIVTWMDWKTNIHGEIYRFRIMTSMLAVVMMGAFVFMKQYLLDQERLRLLEESRRNFESQRHLQAQLIRSEKLAALAQLVSGAAHEINNPLTAILGYSELMEVEAGADETLKSHAGKIKQQVLRTKDLVRNLQRFAQQPGGEKVPLDLNLVVENCVLASEAGVANKRIRFLRELDPKLPPVLGDEKQLTDVCMQLLGNAASFLARSDGGQITARTSRDSDWVVLEIRDSGPGIANPDRVFDPFFTTKTVGRGTGLGLSVCYGIVADHKGFIFAENLPQGGARLVVRLPIAGAAKPQSVSL
jgi:signal transduction histidine kinase